MERWYSRWHFGYSREVAPRSFTCVEPRRQRWLAWIGRPATTSQTPRPHCPSSLHPAQSTMGAERERDRERALSGMGDAGGMNSLGSSLARNARPCQQQRHCRRPPGRRPPRQGPPSPAPSAQRPVPSAQRPAVSASHSGTEHRVAVSTLQRWPAAWMRWHTYIGHHSPPIPVAGGHHSHPYGESERERE
jgi:hypothetical protein